MTKELSINAITQSFDVFSMNTQNQIAELDNVTAREKANIESSRSSEEEKRKKIEILDQQAAKKKSELMRKQAVQEKASGVFSVGVNTIVAGMKAWAELGPLAGPIMAGIIGILGGLQAAMIMAKPLPLAEGALVKGGHGGVRADIGEKNHDELVMPLKTGIISIVDGLVARLSAIAMPQAVPVFAGNTGFSGDVRSSKSELHLHIGTMIGNDRGYKELERLLMQYRVQETQRRGGA